jgi:hypothetical protein
VPFHYQADDYLQDLLAGAENTGNGTQ